MAKIGLKEDRPHSDSERKEHAHEIHCAIFRMRSRWGIFFRSWLWSWIRMADDRHWSRSGKTLNWSYIGQQWESACTLGRDIDQVRVEWDFYAYCTITTKSEAADVEEPEAIENQTSEVETTVDRGWRMTRKWKRARIPRKVRDL
jgi:hypothetical protein